VTVGGHDDPAGQRHHVATDPSGDVGVTVHDDDAARDVAADDQVAVAHSDVVGHGAGDGGVAIHRDHRSAHGLTAGDEDVTADADPAIAAIIGVAGAGRCCGDGQSYQRKRADCRQPSAHSAPPRVVVKEQRRATGRRVQRPAAR
jgi:hypothetical protein